VEPPDEADWIAINLPGIALVHIMSPSAHNYYFAEEEDKGLSINERAN
jgi:hypothetical protein